MTRGETAAELFPAVSRRICRNAETMFSQGFSTVARRVESMSKQGALTIDDLLDRVEELHSSPVVAQQILAALEDPLFEIAEIEGILQRDPALAGAVLRVVNSSSLGLRNKVASLRQAIAFLGARALRLVVLSFGLVARLTTGAPAEICNDYWRRALTMAAAASKLAPRREMPRDEAYAAGLIADVGVLVILQVETSRYTNTYRKHVHGPRLLEAEADEFGFSHPEVGARLLSRWKLPDSMIEAAGQHHEPPARGNPALLLVQAGDRLADALWTPRSPHLPQTRQFFRQELELDLDGLITLANDCQRDVQAQAEVFGVRLPKGVDCESLQTRAQQLFRSEAVEIALDWESTTSALAQGVGTDL